MPFVADPPQTTGGFVPDAGQFVPDPPQTTGGFVPDAGQFVPDTTQAPAPVSTPSPSPAPTPAWQAAPVVQSQQLQISGMVKPGNIDLNKRPIVYNQDGSISTVKSISVGTDAGEVLIPTVAADGSGLLSPQDAIKQWRKTGQMLGVFKTADDATKYAEQVHSGTAPGYTPEALARYKQAENLWSTKRQKLPDAPMQPSPTPAPTPSVGQVLNKEMASRGKDDASLGGFLKEMGGLYKDEFDELEDSVPKVPYVKAPEGGPPVVQAINKNLAGFQNAAADVVNMFDRPSSIALMAATSGLSEASPIAAKLIKLGFTGVTLKGLYQSIKAIPTALDAQTRAHAIYGAVMNAAMAAGLVFGEHKPTKGEPDASQKGQAPTPANPDPAGDNPPAGQTVQANPEESRSGGGGQSGGDGSVEGEKPKVRGWSLYPSDTINIRSGQKTPDEQITRIRKTTNDAGKTVYAVEYTKPDGVKYIGYTDDPAIEGHPKYEGEYKPAGQTVQANPPEARSGGGGQPGGDGGVEGEKPAAVGPGVPDGPGTAAGGVTSEIPPSGTGLKRVVVDMERLRRGAPEIPTPERQRQEDVVKEAEGRVNANPVTAPALVARIVDGGEAAITEGEAATLLVERQRLSNERSNWEQVKGNPESTPSERAQAQVELDLIENQVDRVDKAQRAAGSSWSDVGRMYQRIIQEDFSLDALERKARASKGGPLSEVERDQIKEQAQKISDLQKVVDASKDVEKKAQAQEQLTRAHEATIKDLQDQAAKKPKYGKEVFDIAHGIVNRWKAEAETAHQSLRSRLSRTSAGIDPTILVDVAKIMRAHVGELGLNAAESGAKLVAEYGEAIRPYLDKAWVKAQGLIGSEKTKTSAVREVLKRGEKKVRTEATSTDIKARAKAEAVAGEGLNHKTVYDLARAHINEELAKGNKASGAEGESATIKAVHSDLKEYHPDLTEDQVRQAYSEYGKVKFPSEAEDKVRLSEYRRIGQLDLQIKDLQKGLDAKRSGIQRDKATQAIRDLTKQRNDLLQKHAGPPSPERIASRDEAKQTALKNAIEDTDRELQTGIRVERAAGQPDSPATERLRAELQAMRDKLKEIRDAANAPQDEADRIAKQQETIKKQIVELEAKVGGKGPDTKGQNVNRPGHPALEPLMQQRDALRTQLADARAKQANAEALERKADQLRQQVEAKKAKLASGDLSTDAKGQKMNRPAATAEIERAQQELDAVNKQLADARKVVAGEEALQKKLDKMNEDINSKTAKLKAGDLSTDAKGQKMNRPLPNQALEEAKQKLDDLNKQMSDARKAAHQASLGTPEERYNRTRQKAVAKQLADVKARIAEGKYERPAKKVPPAKTDATRRAEVQLALEKNKFTEGLLRQEKANRPPIQRTVQDIADMAKGFAVSGYHSLIKIASFDIAKLVEEPLLEMVGVGASKLTGSARGSLESGAGPKKALGAYYKGFSRGVKEALGVYRTGRAESDLLYGKPRLSDAKWYDWIGSRLHGAMKHTVFSAAEEKYRVNGFANAEKAGLDISNEFVRAAINKAAYDRAFSAKLQENNVVSNVDNMLHSHLEKVNPDTGEPDITKQVVSSALKTFVTKGIIKTPANFVSQVMQRTPLGLAAGLGKFARGSWRGLDTLKPSEVDAIHALLKTGAVGSAMFIWGAIDATKPKKDRIFGGYYSPGRKPDDGDVKWGTIRVGVHTIPHVLAHNFLTEPAQMGNTMMRVAMERFNQKDGQTKGMLEGALYSIVALGAQAPVAGPILRMSSPGANLSGQVIQGLVPQFLANIAGDWDKNTERSPKTPLQQLEVQIPGLRSQVPESNTRRTRSTTLSAPRAPKLQFSH